ncbi:MAG: hypothetical protein HJJLKODD_02854 [Phycisphaerae bacterium]|nr:hypothetical protein [Phycisphaerae bacterium]
MNLLPRHLSDLQRSGLTDETIQACGFRSESRYTELARLANWKFWPKRMGAALVIPFTGPEGAASEYHRLKPDNPRPDKNGKSVKYESPKGKSNRIFIPPGTFAILSAPSKPLFITEGEKKAAKVDQEGFPCVGLAGVFGWKNRDSEQLIHDLRQIVWSGRQVIICFDSDIDTNQNVQDAESRLAFQLQLLGASVRCMRLGGSA